MKKYVSIIRLYFLTIVRSSVWSLLLVFGILVSCISYLYVYGKEPFLAVNQMSYGQVIITIILMMIGIEIRREERSLNIDDLSVAYSKKKLATPLVHVITISIISIIITMIIELFCFVRMLVAEAPKEWIIETVIFIMLFFMIPCIISGIWGLLISQIIKGKSVYLPATLIWFLTSSLCTYIVGKLPFKEGALIKPLVNFFNMGLNSFHMFRNIMISGETELPRWIVRIWILLILAVIYISLYCNSLYPSRLFKVRYVDTVGFITLSILLMSFLFVRYNVFFSRFSDPNDVMNYVWDKSGQYTPGQLASIEDFPPEKNISIKETDINISCNDMGITAEVRMSAVQEKTMQEQAFTLYSDFIIDEIFINGEKSQYTRSLDGILIEYPSIIEKGETVEIGFRYHGYSLPSFPANETTVQLNRAFPWIPWPGIRTISLHPDLYDETERFLIADWQRGDSVIYTLHYNGPGNIYCNLSHQNDTYVGISENGVSIYSGMLQEEYNGIEVYIPVSQYDIDSLPAQCIETIFEQLNDVCEILDTGKSPQKPESVTLIQMRVPVIAGFPQELYFWGNEWEIRIRNESSAVITTLRRALAYKGAEQPFTEISRLTAGFAVSTAVGFPSDVAGNSKEYFVKLLSLYLQLKTLLNHYPEYSQEEILSLCEISLIESQDVLENQDEFNTFVHRVLDGEDFNDELKKTYHYLSEAKDPSPDDLIAFLAF